VALNAWINEGEIDLSLNFFHVFNMSKKRSRLLIVYAVLSAEEEGVQRQVRYVEEQVA